MSFIWKLLGLCVAIASFAVLFYLSRFWIFNLWPRDGLGGIEWIRPQGALVGRWLRGTDFAPFELLIWAVGAFLLLSFLQRIVEYLNRDKH